MKRLTTSALICLISASFATASFGWGRIEHRASARAAETRLSTAARRAIKDLLEPGETLADAAVWPDEHRREMPESGPWHYINVPISEREFSRKFCPPQGDVVTRIEAFRKILADPSKPKSERRTALRFFVHFVQDIHQPVHVGNRDDRGGNDLQLVFFDNPTNLHRIWDFEIFEHKSMEEDYWVDRLEAAIDDDSVKGQGRKGEDDWAGESLELAGKAYLNGPGGKPLVSGAKLGKTYYEANLPRAERRLATATFRLVEELNAIWP